MKAQVLTWSGLQLPSYLISSQSLPYSLFACHTPSLFLEHTKHIPSESLGVWHSLCLGNSFSVGYVASFLSPSGHIPRKTISDPSQTIHAHQPITFYSLILLYFFPY